MEVAVFAASRRHRAVRQELAFTSSVSVKLSQSDSRNSKHFRTLVIAIIFPHKILQLLAKILQGTKSQRVKWVIACPASLCHYVRIGTRQNRSFTAVHG